MSKGVVDELGKEVLIEYNVVVFLVSSELIFVRGVQFLKLALEYLIDETRVRAATGSCLRLCLQSLNEARHAHLKGATLFFLLYPHCIASILGSLLPLL